MASASTPLSVSLSLARVITQTRTVEDVYAAALDAVGAAFGASRAAILLFDPDGVLRFKAWRGLSVEYRAAVEGHSPWTRTSLDLDPIVVVDVRQDPGLAPWRAALDAEGIGAMVFVPLVSASRVIGKMMLYRDEPWAPAPDALELTGLIAAQIAFAVERTRASQQLTALVESSGDAIVSKDLNGIITTWNPAAEKLFGYSSDEAIGRPIALIIPSERLPEEALVLERIRAGVPVAMETIRRRKDGSSVPISLMVSPILAADGRVVGASKVARDISARRRDEAERAELHRRLTLLVGASARLLDSLERSDVIAATMALARELLPADGHALWGSDPGEFAWRIVGSAGVSERFAGRVIRRDDGAPPGSGHVAHALAITDVTTAPIVAAELEAYQDEGIRSMLVCPMRLNENRFATLVFYHRTTRTFSEGEIESGETLANLAAAAIARVELHSQLRAERNDAEAGRRQAAFLADATAMLSESLEYEETLASVAQRAVPEIADCCLVDLVDASGGLELVAVAHADPAKAELARAIRHHYPSHPNTLGSVHDVVRSGRPLLQATIDRAGVAEYAHDDEHRELLGRLSLTSSMCVPIVSPRGSLGAITFVQSESGRHYEPRDLILAQELAARAALAIENAVAYRRANEASRAKDEFLATLSHELRTPLNAVLGYAQMLDRGILGEERRQQAMTILVRNGRALKQLIDDVLDVSRIATGRLRLSARPVNLRDIVNAAVATTQPAADAKNLRIDVASALDGASVWGDPDRLQQIVWNLLSNAVKFTSRGGHVEVRLDVADGWVRLTVADDGQGIAPEFLPRIFERFTQADSRSSREHGGLGLGLAIVRELTELHGGAVLAASEGLGRGATFRVRLPLMEPGALAEGRRDSGEHAIAPEPSPRPGD